MPIIHSLLPEIDHEAKTTVRVLQRVPSDRLSWQPHAKSSSLGKLAWHIARIPAIVQNFLRVDVFDVAQSQPVPMPDDAAEIVAAYERNLADTRAFLETLSDDVLRENFAMKRGEKTMVSLPKLGVVRNILMNHTYHHRGQLTVYLRLLDVPVPSVYGPTADEAL